jgi:MFS family permease
MQRKWWTLLVVSVATFMLLLDITVVNVALPSIRQDLGASFTDLQWVVDAYALTLAALLSFAGAVLTLWLVRGVEIQRQPWSRKASPSPTPCRRLPRPEAGRWCKLLA